MIVAHRYRCRKPFTMTIDGEVRRVLGGEMISVDHVPNLRSMIASGYIDELLDADNQVTWVCLVAFDTIIDGVKVSFKRGDTVPGSAKGLERFYRAGYIRQGGGCFWICCRRFDYTRDGKTVTANIGDVITDAHNWRNRIAMERCGWIRCVSAGKAEEPAKPKPKKQKKSKRPDPMWQEWLD